MSAAKTTSVLRAVGTVIIPATEWFDPAVLQTGPGLWVSDGFDENVRKHATAGPVGELTLPYGDLEERATIDEIVAESGREHEPRAACYALYTLTRQQPNGKEGHLLSNGYVNLLPIIGGPAADVHWSADYGKWLVDDWSRYGNRWHRGDRAF
jgi:hypothetical protein